MSEEIFPNGLGLAFVKTFIKKENGVELRINNCRDLSPKPNSTLINYNHVYVVENKITGETFCYDDYYTGGDINKQSDRKFYEQVDKNKRIINNVKKYLGI